MHRKLEINSFKITYIYQYVYQLIYELNQTYHIEILFYLKIIMLIIISGVNLNDYLPDNRTTAYFQVKQAFYDGTVKLQPELIALEVDLTCSKTPKKRSKTSCFLFNLWSGLYYTNKYKEYC